MFSSCKPLTDAQIKGDTVVLPPGFESGMCWGAFSALQRLIVKAYDGQPIFRVCAPPKSTRIQLFVEYARRNPQRLHEDFFDVAVDALRAAFPCQAR